METHKSLLKSYQGHVINAINKNLEILERGQKFKLDNQIISCSVKFMKHCVSKAKINEYAPHHEIQKIQIKVIEHQKQLDNNLLLSTKHATQNEQENATLRLAKLSGFVQGKNFKTAEEITAILKNTSDPMETNKSLLKSYQEHVVNAIHKNLAILDRGQKFKLDNEIISCPIKFMEHCTSKAKINEYAPHHEIQKIQNKVVERQKQLDNANCKLGEPIKARS